MMFSIFSFIVIVSRMNRFYLNMARSRGKKKIIQTVVSHGELKTCIYIFTFRNIERAFEV